MKNRARNGFTHIKGRNCIIQFGNSFYCVKLASAALHREEEQDGPLDVILSAVMFVGILIVS
jgi:hypothetical protein